MTDVDLAKRLNDLLPAIEEYRLIGLSTTTKPTTAPNGGALAEGTIFDERDTGVRWIWKGSTFQWISLGPMTGLVDVAAAIGVEMAHMRRVAAALRTELRAIRILLGLQVGVAVPADQDEPTV